MARINVELPDELIIEFRKNVLDRKGSLRGGVSEALTEAIKLWVDDKK